VAQVAVCSQINTKHINTDGTEAWTLTKKEEQALINLKGRYLEKCMALNMKMGNGKDGRIENKKR